MSGEASAFDLPALARGLPPPPPASLGPYLDAAARCFARHGIRRTSVRDVARELGVERTTVYRHVGSVDRMVRLLLARELHVLLSTLPSRLPASSNGPDAVVDLLTTVVTWAGEHPVLAKVLEDEPELIGPFLVHELADLIERVTSVVEPLLASGAAAGLLADGSARERAEWLVRAGISVLLAPPDGDLRAFLGTLVVPLFRPA
jgi:AcrR family transcriptional regulator